MLEKLELIGTRPMKWRTDPLSDKARELVTKELTTPLTGKLEPLSLSEAYESLPRDTSPGLPLSRFTNLKKRDVRLNTLHLAHEIIRQTMHGWKDYRFPPAQLASRCQLCPVGKNKPRLVWVYPIIVSLFEQCFAVPLVGAWRNTGLFAWNVNYLRGALPELWKDLVSLPGAGLFGDDVSHYDESLIKEAIRWAFGVCRMQFRFTKKWQMRIWTAIVHYFLETPILAYEWLWLTLSSVPSGSGFTQIIDTLVLAYVQTDRALALWKKNGGASLPTIRTLDEITCIKDILILLKLLGDDALIKTRFPLLTGDREWLSAYFWERHGLEAHPSKGFFSAAGNTKPHGEFEPYNAMGKNELIHDPRLPEFLGKKLVNSSSLTIETELLKAQVYLPESRDTCSGDVATRLVGLAWSCGTSSEHYKFLKSKWIELHDSFPDTSPTPWKRDFIRFFKYVEGVNLPPTRFPSYEEIASRYRSGNEDYRGLNDD